MVQVPPKMDSGTVCVQSRNYVPSCSDLAKSGCGSMGSMANNDSYERKFVAFILKANLSCPGELWAV